MQPKADFDAARVTRSLLRRSRQGALATLAAGSGDPYCSLVNVASDTDGAPILLISQLALHTRNLAADARASLMLDERSAGDPLQSARIMIGGRFEPVDQAALARARQRYLSAHPSAEVYAGFKDFQFFRMWTNRIHIVAEFGRITDLAAADVLTDLSGAEALIEAEADAVAHMNADHQDALTLYATRLLGAAPGDWRCTGCDPEGLDLQADTRCLRLNFAERVTTPVALRHALRALADQARALHN